MKKFSLKLLCNLLIIITVLLILITGYNYKSNRNLNNLIESPKVLIMGDSHAQAAFNPSLIKDAVNIAHYDESYLFSYYKLKEISRYNSEIKTVVLSCSYHNLSSYFEEFNDERFSSSVLSYLPFLDFNGLFAFSEYNYYTLIKMYINKFRFEISTLFFTLIDQPASLSNIEPWGGFHLSERNNLDPEVLNKATTKHFYSPKQFSTNQIKYLSKIVDFCHDSNIDLILVHTPKHIKYRECVTEPFKNKYKMVLDTFCEKITFIDGSDFDLKDSNFGDFDHLNTSGANIFTGYLTDRCSILLKQ